MGILRGAEPFFLPGAQHGVVLIHGFTGSPSEMRPLGDYLNQEGFTVIGPRLSGHGTSPDEMAQTAWPHWYSSVEDSYHLLRPICATIAVVGLSMGGLLAFKLAAEYPLAQVVSINTPIFIADKRLSLLPMYRLFQDFVPKKRRKLAADPAYNVSYDRTPLSSLSSLMQLIKHVDQLLPAVRTPTLIIQSRNERTVRPESARHIYDCLGSSHKRIEWLEHSGHIATLDVDYRQVFAAVEEFLTPTATTNGEEQIR